MKIFIGWDSREDIAYQVCKYSIQTRQPRAVVEPLKQQDLRDQSIYWRDVDEMASTEFTFTRFLVPFLTNYEGWAIFCDCDFLWQVDVAELFNQANNDYAVMVVKHNYTPEEGVKMDGQKQLPYPRKNWSSMILWNCAHPSNKKLNLETINKESGAFLHRFQWLEDNEIGELDPTWNWLVNWYKEPRDGTPKAIHYTEGGPWFPNYIHCEYGANWLQTKNDYIDSIKSEPPMNPILHVPENIKQLYLDILTYRIDPDNEFYKVTEEDLIERLKMLNNKNVYAVDGAKDPGDAKGHLYDPYLQAFVLGAGGQITHFSKVENSMTPAVFRGITKIKHMKKCEELGRDYYYIDTGYFGNNRKKMFHRITKNAMQNLSPVIHRPPDRLEATGWKPIKFRPGRNILLCPPSEKAMSCFGLDLETWMKETLEKIKNLSDRPVIIRTKPSRRDRVTTDTIDVALSKDIHCLVTYNSIAATEAVLLGKPAITLGPNAAQSVCSNSLNEIEDPYIPSLDEVREWAAHLAYCQFTEIEMRNGTAWNILNQDV